MKSLIKSYILLAIAIAIVFPPKAHAYLDPGTGSYVLQVAAAVFFGGLFAIKAFWSQIKNFFSGRKGKTHSEKSTEKDK